MLPSPETLAMMCQVHGNIPIVQTGLKYARAQWSGMLFAGAAQGLGGSTILYVVTGCIHVCLQQGLHRTLRDENNILHRPFQVLSKLHPSMDMPSGFEADDEDNLLTHLVFYTAATKGCKTAGNLTIREVNVHVKLKSQLPVISTSSMLLCDA